MFTKTLTVTILVCTFLHTLVPPAHAASLSHNTETPSETRLNNENWHTLPHPTPETFYVTAAGEVFGTTTNGIAFSQTNVPNKHGVRVQMFSIQDHYHYIVNGTIMYAHQNIDLAIAHEVEKISPLLAHTVEELAIAEQQF